jgi:hypothetical protein
MAGKKSGARMFDAQQGNCEGNALEKKWLYKTIKG